MKLTRRASDNKRTGGASSCDMRDNPLPEDNPSNRVSINILHKGIDSTLARDLARLFDSKTTLRSLCGHTGDEKELDMKNTRLGAAGAIMLVPELEKNLKIQTVNVMGNKIGKEQLVKLQSTMNEHSTLHSLCGIGKEKTEADLSDIKMDDDDLDVLSRDLPTKSKLKTL